MPKPAKTAVTSNGALYNYPTGIHDGQFRKKNLKRTVVISVQATVPPYEKIAL